MKHKVILDCDNTMGMPDWEVDDGLVLLYLLGRDDIDLLGITNVFGNGSLADVSRYTSELLREIGREDIPRFDGAAYRRQNQNLSSTIKSTDRYANEIVQDESVTTEAARFLAEQVAAHPGEITILAAGPVSNLYEASKIDTSFYANVKEIVCMGGYVEDFYVGDTQLEELNLACDPESSHAMFYSQAPVTMMTGHICLQAPFGKKDIDAIDFWPEDRIELLRRWLDRFGGSLGVDVFYLWDLLLPVYVSYPELFDRNPAWIHPTRKSLERGRLEPSTEGTGTTINMPTTIRDQTRFQEILTDAWRTEWNREKGGWK